MMNRLIIFLLRKKFHLKIGECFRFTNQKDPCCYYFIRIALVKGRYVNGVVRPVKLSGVPLNWLISDKCKIIKENRPGGTI